MPPLIKRSSTRAVVVSKNMRRVDIETRNEVRNRHLVMLEADNYVEAEIGGAGDDEYGNNIDDDDNQKRKKTKSNKSSSGLSLSKWSSKRVKPLEKIILEQGYDQARSDDLFALNVMSCVELCNRYPNDLSINAAQSSKPVRKFCSVCGHAGQYACTRCGMRYCSIKCNSHHKETGCMKFSLF